VSAAVPTRWLTRMRAQLDDSDRRLALADRRRRDGAGGRALHEVHPGVMAAALPPVQEARAFVSGVRAEFDRRMAPPSPERGPDGSGSLAG